MKRTFILALLALAAAFGVAQAGLEGKAGKGAPATGRSVLPGDPVVRGGGASVSVAEVRRALLGGAAAHRFRGGGLPEFVTSVAEGQLRGKLVLKAIREGGFDREVAPETAVIRNRFVAARYRQDVLSRTLRPTAEEMRDRYPAAWVRVRFRELTVPTLEEAEKIRWEVLENPERFIPLIRERSTGPKASEDGLTGYVEPLPFNLFLTPEQNAHLFSLKKGEFSDILRSGLGYTIYRVEEVRILPEKEIQKKVSAMEEKAVDGKVTSLLAERKAAEGAWTLFQTDESGAYRLVLDYLEKGTPSREEALRAGPLRLTFRDLIALERLYTWPKPGPLKDPIELQARLKQLSGDLILPEALLAQEADRNGFVLGEADRMAMENKTDDWLKERFYDEVVSPKGSVTPAEVRERFETIRDALRKPATVDYRLIRTADAGRAKEAYDRIRKKGRFEDGLEWANRKGVNKAPGGGTYRAASVDDLETPLRRAISSMKEGRHSGVFRSGDDYLIASLDNVLRWVEPEFGQQEAGIEAALKKEKEARAIEAFFAEKYPGLKVEKDPEAIAFLAEEVGRNLEEGGKTPAAPGKGAPGHKGGHSK